LVTMLCMPFATFALLGNTRSSMATVDTPRNSLRARSPAQWSTANSPSSPPAPGDLPLALAPQDDGRNSDQRGQNESAESVATSWGARIWTMGIGPFLPWISGGWLLGVVAFSARPLLGLVIVSRLRNRGLSRPSAKLTQLATELLKRMQMRPSV